MKKLITSFCLLLSLNGMGQSLPLTVTQTEFNNGDIFYSKPSASWDGSDGIKSSVTGGECSFKFSDAPHAISLQHSRNGAAISPNIQVYESADGSNWSSLLGTKSSSSWQNWSSNLKKETRYIKLKYSGSLSGWWRNIVVTKYPLIASVVVLPKFKATVNTASEKQTFTITKTALTNDVTVTCDNPVFTVSPSTLDKSNGTSDIEVTFNPTEKGEQNGTITVQENGTANKEVIAISGLGTTAQLSATPLIDFSTVEGKAVTQETSVTAKDLEGPITLSISGNGAAHFSVSRSEMTESGIIVVSYLPLASGKHEATLTISTSFAADVVLSLSGTATRSPFNSIFNPLIIGQTEFNNSSIVEKSEVSWGNGTVDSSDGKGSFIVSINGTPHTLTFDCSRNNYGQNRVMKVEESSDKNNWTTLISTDPSTDWKAYQSVLKSTTRYLRLSYSADYKGGDVWAKYCYWRNIKVTKNNVQATTLSLETFTNAMGTSETKRFEIGAANLTGNLQIVSSSNLFTVSPGEVSKDDAERIYGYPIEITYSPIETGKFEGVIDITDNENPSNTLSIQVSGIAKPATPQSLAASDILPTAFQANWQAVEGVRSYLLTVTEEGVETPILNKVDVGNVTSYILSELKPGVKYSYQVWSVGAGELTSDEGSAIIDANTLVRPTITTSTPAEYQTTENIGQKQEITINAENLLGKISIKVVGTNAALFTLNKNELTAGGTIEVTYQPTVSGIHSAILQIETLYIENIVNIPLSGSAKPTAPAALTATDITPVGFTAKWKVQTGVTGYRLWVKDQSGAAVSEYNGKELGVVASHTVKGLKPSSQYTYELTALNANLTSDASNAIEVLTAEAPIITHSPVGEFSTSIGTKTSQQINVGGERLTRYIEVTVSGDYFSVEKNEIQPSGESLKINFEPAKTGSFNGEIRLNTPFAPEVIIPLFGSSISTSIVNTCANNSCAKFIEINDKQLYYTFDNETTVRLFDNRGSMVKAFTGTAGVESLESLSKGVYHIQFTHNEESFILKVIL